MSSISTTQNLISMLEYLVDLNPMLHATKQMNFCSNEGTYSYIGLYQSMLELAF